MRVACGCCPLTWTLVHCTTRTVFLRSEVTLTTFQTVCSKKTSCVGPSANLKLCVSNTCVRVRACACVCVRVRACACVCMRVRVRVCSRARGVCVVRVCILGIHCGRLPKCMWWDVQIQGSSTASHVTPHRRTHPARLSPKREVCGACCGISLRCWWLIYSRLLFCPRNGATLRRASRSRPSVALLLLLTFTVFSL